MEPIKGTGPIQLPEVREAAAARVRQAAPTRLEPVTQLESDANQTNRKTGPLSGSALSLDAAFGAAIKDLPKFEPHCEPVQDIVDDHMYAGRPQQAGGGGSGMV